MADKVSAIRMAGELAKLTDADLQEHYRALLHELGVMEDRLRTLRTQIEARIEATVSVAEKSRRGLE